MHPLILLEILVRPKPGVPDSEKAQLLEQLVSMGYAEITSATRAKYFQIKLHDTTTRKARANGRKFCQTLLANSVIEDFEIHNVQIIAPLPVSG